MGIIRLILAISVVVSHSSAIFGLKFVDADLAVKTFYIISGFYMSLILNEKYVNQKHAYRLFITNRFLRLFPIYWIILALTLLFFAIIYRQPNESRLGTTCLQMYANYFHSLGVGSFCFLIFTNVFLFFQDVVMFLGLDPATGHLFFTTNYRTTSPELFRFLFVPQAWTIGIELLFYLIAPFIVRKNIKIVGGLIIVSVLLRAVLYRSGLNHDPWTYRFFPAEVAFFLIGSLSYAIYRKIRVRSLKSFFLNVLWVAVIMVSVSFSIVEFPFKRYFYLLLVFISLPFIFHHTKKSKTDSYIGELSYPIYISHMFIASVLLLLNFPTTKWLGLVLAITTILFSIALNELVGKRIENFRQKRVRSLPQKNIAV
jgi:peptidoglycan/LPS O-acetylase OafA/YrhL